MGASADTATPKSNGKATAKTALTPEQHRQLLTLHMGKLRGKAAQIEDLRVPLKDAQEEFTAMVNEAKADLGKGYTRKYLLTLLEDTTTRLRNLIEEEQRRARDREALGLPVFGVQADLFDTEAAARMPAEARDELHWEAEGYLRGRNGLLQEIPDGAPPRFHPTILKGYERGQKATLEEMAAAAELKKTLAEPAADQKPVKLNETEISLEDQEVIDRRTVAAVKRSLEAMGSAANEVAA